MITIKLVRSVIGCQPRQRKVVEALGLRRLNMVKTFKDTAAIRGMIAKIPQMLEVVK